MNGKRFIWWFCTRIFEMKCLGFLTADFHEARSMIYAYLIHRIDVKRFWNLQFQVNKLVYYIISFLSRVQLHFLQIFICRLRFVSRLCTSVGPWYVEWMKKRKNLQYCSVYASMHHFNNIIMCFCTPSFHVFHNLFTIHLS